MKNKYTNTKGTEKNPSVLYSRRRGTQPMGVGIFLVSDDLNNNHLLVFVALASFLNTMCPFVISLFIDPFAPLEKCRNLRINSMDRTQGNMSSS